MMAELDAGELATVAGGLNIMQGVKDGYRGAVNWGLGAYAGTKAAMQLYENKPSPGAWFAQVKGMHDALDSTGKLPDAVPFSKYY